MSKETKQKTDEWVRPEMTFKILEPKRWFHYLGFSRKELDYTISFYIKSECDVKIWGQRSEWKNKKQY